MLFICDLAFMPEVRQEPPHRVRVVAADIATQLDDPKEAIKAAVDIRFVRHPHSKVSAGIIFTGHTLALMQDKPLSWLIGVILLFVCSL